MNIQIDEICLTSYPCQHHVTIDGVSQGKMLGTKIYRLLRDNDQPISEHFFCYKSKVDTQDIVTAMREQVSVNELVRMTGFESNLRDVLHGALRYDRDDLIDWLMDNRGYDMVTTDHLLLTIEHGQHDRLKLLADGKDANDLRTIGMCIYGKGNNLISYAVYHKNLQALKYLLEVKGVEFPATNPLDCVTYDRLTPPIVEYLANYHGVTPMKNAAHICNLWKRRTDMFNLLSQQGVIANVGDVNFDLQIDSHGNQLVETLSRRGLDRRNWHQINFHDFFHQNTLRLSWDLPYFIEEIALRVTGSLQPKLTAVYLDLNGYKVPFTLTDMADGRDQIARLTPLEPISLKYATFTDKTLCIEAEADQGHRYLNNCTIDLTIKDAEAPFNSTIKITDNMSLILQSGAVCLSA